MSLCRTPFVPLTELECTNLFLVAVDFVRYFVTHPSRANPPLDTLFPIRFFVVSTEKCLPLLDFVGDHQDVTVSFFVFKSL